MFSDRSSDTISGPLADQGPHRQKGGLALCWLSEAKKLLPSFTHHFVSRASASKQAELGDLMIRKREGMSRSKLGWDRKTEAVARERSPCWMTRKFRDLWGVCAPFPGIHQWSGPHSPLPWNFWYRMRATCWPGTSQTKGHEILFMDNLHWYSFAY